VKSAFEKEGIVDLLEKCQYHPNIKVYTAASEILQNHFEAEM
jgi:hypothetical protein